MWFDIYRRSTSNPPILPYRGCSQINYHHHSLRLCPHLLKKKDEDNTEQLGCVCGCVGVVPPGPGK